MFSDELLVMVADESKRQGLAVRVQDTVTPIVPVMSIIYELTETRKKLADANARLKTRIVCLCGSTRFKQEYEQQEYRWALAGWIVVTVGAFREPNEKRKVMLDELRLRKIDLADKVYVIDVGGYIGNSTKSEIEYARSLGKPIAYYSKDPDRSAS